MTQRRKGYFTKNDNNWIAKTWIHLNRTVKIILGKNFGDLLHPLLINLIRSGNEKVTFTLRLVLWKCFFLKLYFLKLTLCFHPTLTFNFRVFFHKSYYPFSDVAAEKKQSKPSYLKLSSSTFKNCTESPQTCFTSQVSQSLVAEFLLAFNRFQCGPKILSSLSHMWV